MSPMQLGPIKRIPWSAAILTHCASRSAPTGPASRKPPDTMMAALMPRRPHSASRSGTNPAGTSNTARSTGSGTSESEE